MERIGQRAILRQEEVAAQIALLSIFRQTVKIVVASPTAELSEKLFERIKSKTKETEQWMKPQVKS